MLDGWPLPNPLDGWALPNPLDGWALPNPLDGWPLPNPLDGWPLPNPLDGWPLPNPLGGWPLPNVLFVCDAEPNDCGGNANPGALLCDEAPAGEPNVGVDVLPKVPLVACVVDGKNNSCPNVLFV